MAIDSAAKRRSIPGINFYAGLTNPVADGAIGLADRQQTGYGYIGIAADAPVAPSGQLLQIPRHMRAGFSPMHGGFSE